MSHQTSTPARAVAPCVQSHSGKDQHATGIDLDIGHLSDAELANRMAAARARIESSFFGSHKSA